MLPTTTAPNTRGFALIPLAMVLSVVTATGLIGLTISVRSSVRSLQDKVRWEESFYNTEDGILVSHHQFKRAPDGPKGKQKLLFPIFTLSTNNSSSSSGYNPKKYTLGKPLPFGITRDFNSNSALFPSYTGKELFMSIPGEDLASPIKQICSQQDREGFFGEQHFCLVASWNPPRGFIRAVPNRILPNSSTQIQWTSERTSSCTVSPWNLSGTSGNATTPQLLADTLVTLNCTGPRGPIVPTPQAWIRVLKPPTVDLKVNGGDAPFTVLPNTSAVLSWTSSDASSCTLSPLGWTGIVEPGKATGPIATTTTFTVNCTGPMGSATDSVTVTILPKPLVTLYANGVHANMLSVPYNSRVNLTWSTQYATSCSLNGSPVTVQNTAGNITSPVVALQNHTLVCTNQMGTSQDTVQLNYSALPPTVDLRVNGLKSLTVDYPTIVNYTWTSTNAVSCTIQQLLPTLGAQVGIAINGTWSLGAAAPASHQYRVTCLNSTGNSAQDTVTALIRMPQKQTCQQWRKTSRRQSVLEEVHVFIPAVGAPQGTTDWTPDPGSEGKYCFGLQQCLSANLVVPNARPWKTKNLFKGNNWNQYIADCVTNGPKDPACGNRYDAWYSPTPFPKLAMPPASYVYKSNTYQLWTGNSWGSAQCPAKTLNYSPLVIDMAATGLEITPPADGADFDLIGEGKKHRYSWVSKNQEAYFVALDKNKNGQIDDIHELFGDNTRGPDGNLAPGGFEALQKYDLNGDGFIDSKDPVYSELFLWQDRDLSGTSVPSELTPLSKSQVVSIDLAYFQINESVDFYGNENKQRSVITLKDGSMRPVFDVWFVNWVRPPWLETRDVSSM